MVHNGHGTQPEREFPVSAGVLLGLGMGAFFDGIVLHQILQWHHMISSTRFPAVTLANLQVNVLADGLFHGMAYVFVFAGLVRLWRQARRAHPLWSAHVLAATVLIGFGLFNLVEGVINHQILGIHHVNETVPQGQRIWWDLGFLVWGAAMLGVGAWMMRRRAGGGLSR